VWLLHRLSGSPRLPKRATAAAAAAAAVRICCLGTTAADTVLIMRLLLLLLLLLVMLLAGHMQCPVHQIRSELLKHVSRYCECPC
jgi:hypothetical protein